MTVLTNFQNSLRFSNKFATAIIGDPTPKHITMLHSDIFGTCLTWPKNWYVLCHPIDTHRAVTMLPSCGKPDTLSSAALLDTSVSCISRLARIMSPSNLWQTTSWKAAQSKSSVHKWQIQTAPTYNICNILMLIIQTSRKQLKISHREQKSSHSQLFRHAISNEQWKLIL